jgi:hypothetical protein
MVLVHNMLLRGLNSIYLQAQHISKADEVPFCKYIQVWHLILHHHHAGEEDDLFPGVDRMVGGKDVMAANVEQHHAFKPGLDAFIAYVQDCAAGKQSYDGDKIITLIDAFGKILSDHLADEIPTILDLRKFGVDKLEPFPKLMDEYGEKALVSRIVNPPSGSTAHCFPKKSLSLTADLPWAFVNIDKEFEGGRWKSWPPAPAVIGFVVCNVAYWVHSDVWRFGSCDRSCRMKPLYATGE